MSAKAAVKAKKKPEDILAFCSRCFATSEGGSWGGGPDVVGDRSLCSNCGANNSHVKIPRWAIDSIREQASWVGKRYYAHDEDKERYEEIKALRALVTEYPGRSAEKVRLDRPDDEGMWMVSQDLPDNRQTSVTVKAKSAEGALAKARLLLPYIPRNALKPKA
jgi:hypothetical protein